MSALDLLVRANISSLTTVDVAEVQENDVITLLGMLAKVKYSEPHSDFLWSISYETYHQDGDPFTGSLLLPYPNRVTVWRKTP